MTRQRYTSSGSKPFLIREIFLYNEITKKDEDLSVFHIPRRFTTTFMGLSPKLYPNLSFVCLVENLQFFFSNTLYEQHRWLNFYLQVVSLVFFILFYFFLSIGSRSFKKSLSLLVATCIYITYLHMFVSVISNFFLLAS